MTYAKTQMSGSLQAGSSSQAPPDENASDSNDDPLMDMDQPNQGVGDPPSQGVGDPPNQGVGDPLNQGVGDPLTDLMDSESSELGGTTLSDDDEQNDAPQQNDALNRLASEALPAVLDVMVSA